MCQALAHRFPHHIQAMLNEAGYRLTTEPYRTNQILFSA